MWTYVLETGSDFINKARIQSGVMCFDFVQKWSNQINQVIIFLILFNLIQHNLTLQYAFLPGFQELGNIRWGHIWDGFILYVGMCQIVSSSSAAPGMVHLFLVTILSLMSYFEAIEACSSGH